MPSLRDHASTSHDMTDEIPVPEYALTLTQPWATLVAIQAKIIETRGWPTKHRGPLAIHAAKAFPVDAHQVAFSEPFKSVLEAVGITHPSELPTAAIIATTTLNACYRFGDDTLQSIMQRSRRGEYPAHEALFGDYSAGRYGFLLDTTIALKQPVPARGMLGLWKLPDDVRSALGAQLRAA